MSGQGQSEITEEKERGFASAFSVNLKIVKSLRWSPPYFHFDANAGGGVNLEVGCIGSPVAFIRAARRIGMGKYAAFFVDHDPVRIGELLGNDEISGDPRHFIVEGDNAEFLRSIPFILRARNVSPGSALGSVLLDDNGTGVPFDALAALSAECPKLDVFINLPAAGLKRTLHLPGHGRRVGDILGAIDKKCWLIREPLGKFQWTILLGRNIQVNDHRAARFHHLGSDRGQEIFEACNFTNVERGVRAAALQPSLL